MPVSSPKSERSCMCIRGIDCGSSYEFGTVPKVWDFVFHFIIRVGTSEYGTVCFFGGELQPSEKMSDISSVLIKYTSP